MNYDPATARAYKHALTRSITIDLNVEHGLALVQDIETEDRNTRYVTIDQGGELCNEPLSQHILGQLHYVASHVPSGLLVLDRIGNEPPEQGWQRWKQ